MAVSTIRSPAPRNYEFNLQSGNSVTITNYGTGNVFSIIVTVSGTSDFNGMYLLSGYGTSDGTHFVTTISDASKVSVAKSSGKFVVNHASGTAGFRASFLVLVDDNNALTFSFS